MLRGRITPNNELTIHGTLWRWVNKGPLLPTMNKHLEVETVAENKWPAARLKAHHSRSVLHLLESIWKVTGTSINCKLICKAWRHLSTWQQPNHSSRGLGVCRLCVGKDKVNTEHPQDFTTWMPASGGRGRKEQLDFSDDLYLPLFPLFQINLFQPSFSCCFFFYFMVSFFFFKF